MNAVKLERAVLSQLMTSVLTKEAPRPIADSIADALLERNEALETRIVAAQTRLSEAHRGAEQIADAIEQAGFSSILLKRLEEREEEIRQLEAELVQIRGQFTPADSIPAISDTQLEQWLDTLRESLVSDEREVARQVIQKLVTKVVIRGEEVTLYYTFPFTTEIRKEPARPEGFEPTTVGSEDQCSIH